MIKDDSSVIHFNNPKVQASLQSNTFAISGHAEHKQITDMLPTILNQLGSESITHLKRLASSVQAPGESRVSLWKGELFTFSVNKVVSEGYFRQCSSRFVRVSGVLCHSFTH